MSDEQSLVVEVEQVVTRLRRRQLRGSRDVAVAAVKLFRSVVEKAKWTTSAELLSEIRCIAARLTLAVPSETSSGNMACRVMQLIRQVTHELVAGDDNENDNAANVNDDTFVDTAIDTAQHQPQSDAAAPQSSGAELQRHSQSNEDDHAPFTAMPKHKESLLMLPGFGFPFPRRNTEKDELNTCNEQALKERVVDAVDDLLAEIQESSTVIACQATLHIHANEVIMTMGYSRTVEEFLCEAARKRKFQVFVAESQPGFQGQELALALAKVGIETTVIADAAIYAAMSYVNKVIIGTHSVMADGGLMALNGGHALTLAASHHCVPVIVVAPLFKLSPQFLCAYDQESFNNLVNPGAVMDYSKGDIVGHVSIQNPVFDYVPPDLVTLIISNVATFAPTYVYRLLSEYYHPDDTSLKPHNYADEK